MKWIFTGLIICFPYMLTAGGYKCSESTVLGFIGGRSDNLEISKDTEECALKAIHLCFRDGDVSKGFSLLVRVYNADPDFIKHHKIYRIIKTAKYIVNLKTEAEKKRDPNLWNKLALSYYKMGVFHEAINAYKRSLQIDPNQIEPRLTLALSLSRVGQKYSAIDELMDVISIDKNNFFAYYYAGKILKYQIKDEKKAYFYLKKAKSICEKREDKTDSKLYAAYEKDLENELKK